MATAGLQSAILLEDIFDVVKINPDGKKFERGERALRVEGGCVC
jgi:hypothetical protein